ncbi:SDR family NAD(P)-dependent oxidoreductase [soil metagenome]
MSTTLTGHTALVTGAGRGMGRAISLELARAGATVVVVARTQSEIDAVAQEITQAGGRAIAIAADVGSDEQIEASVAAAHAAVGDIDILINNAGYSELGLIEEQDPAIWWRQLEVGLRNPYTYSRLIIPMMRRKGWGRIVNVSSILGKIGNAYQTAYAAAKHGLIGFTRALAVELAKSNITVNAICPGYVRTSLSEKAMAQRSVLHNIPRDQLEKHALSLIPQGKITEPEEVAPAVMFLVSEAAARITGESLNISGGRVMH